MLSGVKWQCCCGPHLVWYSLKKALQSNLEVVLQYNWERFLCIYFCTSFHLEVSPEKCHVEEQITLMIVWGLFPEICEKGVSGQP